MRKKKKDGRSNPRLKPCPPEEQRYVIRHCTKHGLPLIDVGYGKLPNLEKLRKEIEVCLKGHGYTRGTFTLLSTRPRPRHVATYKFKPDVTKIGRVKRKLVLIR